MLTISLNSFFFLSWSFWAISFFVCVYANGMNFTWQDIIRLPRLFRFLQRPLAQLISVLRAPKSKEGYAAIGGGSPLRKITDEQVQKHLCLFMCSVLTDFYFIMMVRFQLVITLLSSSLQASVLKIALETKEVPANVYVAMRYWHPFTEEAVHQVA